MTDKRVESPLACQILFVENLEIDGIVICCEFDGRSVCVIEGDWFIDLSQDLFSYDKGIEVPFSR